MRPIDADAVREKWCENCSNIHLCGDKDWCDEVKELYDMPIIEAEPIKHGRWIWDKEHDKMYCSNCNYETDDWGVDQSGKEIKWQLTPYCQNCGAKMDEVAE